MKIKILRGIILILLACTFVIIFGFSSQDGEETSGVSRKVSETIINIYTKGKEISQEEKENLIQKIHPIVRKLAHFSIYTVVGFLLMSFTYTYNLKQEKRILISLIIGMAYALSDEFHQSFIPGRSAQIRDVLIDTSGVITGMFIICIYMILYKKIVSVLASK